MAHLKDGRRTGGLERAAEEDEVEEEEVVVVVVVGRDQTKKARVQPSGTMEDGGWEGVR